MYNIIFIILFLFTLKGDDLHPQPPASPTLQAWADHETVYLYWDKKSENSVDPYTGYSDFEGYRLYRSDDGGETWGGIWDKIFDYSENQVGWNPIVQYDYTVTQDTSRCTYTNDFKYNDGTPCDLCVGSTCSDDQTGAYSTVGGCETVINVFQQSCDATFLGQLINNECPISCGVTQNIVRFTRDTDINGYDPEALWVNLGNNSGILRLYKDTDVIDGKEYIYAITAYDMGLRTYEVEFSDEDEDGVFVGDTTWSTSNPDHKLSPYGGALHSLESPVLYESFTDYNKNGTWDIGEPFIDCDVDAQGDSICEDDENWDDTLGNDIWDKRINPINVVTIVPGYLASNVESFIKDGEPNLDVLQDFIQSDTSNIGNGNAQVNVVNENDIESAFFRFEIDACLNKYSYGDTSSSFASGCKSLTFNAGEYSDCAPGCLETGPPSLYAYEIMDTISFTPVYTQTIDIPLTMSMDSILFYKGLPGADTTDLHENDPKIYLPVYTIENFKLEYMNHENFDWVNNWTEWFNGFHYRMDNNFEMIPPTAWASAFTRVVPSDLVDNDGDGYFSEGDESDLLDRVLFALKYQNDAKSFARHPNYSYKITFSTDVLDTARAVSPLSACNNQKDIEGNLLKTLLPFRVDNMTLGLAAGINHKDKGIVQGSIDFGEVQTGVCTECITGEIYPYTCVLGQCIYKTGWKNCSWDHNEYFQVQETIYSSNEPDGITEKIFEFKIDFNHQAYFEYIKNNLALPDSAWINALTDAWSEGENYFEGQVVFHGATTWARRGMFYKAKKDVIGSLNPPGIWYDSDGDNMNDNPWETVYPWIDGEYIEIHPYKWFTDGDSWIMDLSAWGRESSTFRTSDLNAISVVPNPYIVASNYGESLGEHKLHFTRLPNICTISIHINYII